MHPAHLTQIFLIYKEEHNDEEKDKISAQDNHYTESVEVQRNIRNQLIHIFNISVSEVWHILLQKKLLPRALLYAASAAVVYLAAYPILNFVFGTGLLNLGIYLPMLVVEPLLTYRFGRVQETVHKAVSKGVRITVGYALLLLVVGVVREWLSLGTVFGAPVGRWALLPLAKMPAGGFIVLGILCAIWRAAAAKRKEYLKREARDTLTVHYQKEGNREP